MYQNSEKDEYISATFKCKLIVQDSIFDSSSIIRVLRVSLLTIKNQSNFCKK